MKKSVKTEAKAIEILQEWLTSKTGENLMNDSTIEPAILTCECGETKALQAFYENDNELAVIAICAECGDDSAFDVLNIY